MATSDIINELEQSDTVLDNQLQIHISKSILSQLDDGSTDVQTVAIKALAVLVKKLSIEQLNDAVDKLCILLIDVHKIDSVDLYSIGLKTLITSINDTNGIQLCNNLCKKILHGLQRNTNELIDLCMLDVLRDCIIRFGVYINELHNDIVDQICQRLEYKNDSIRKRANQVIGSISPALNDKLYDKLMCIVINKIEQSKSNTIQLYTYLQTISILCSSSGIRIGKYLNQLLPPLQKFCTPDTTASTNTNTNTAFDDEQLIQLYEHCLQAYESILVRCPVQSIDYIPDILKLTYRFISFDPNYSYNDTLMADTDDQSSADTADWDDGDNAATWSDSDDAGIDTVDTDDMSWLVRRGASRVLHSFIEQKPHSRYYHEYYSDILDLLISRLNERIHNVKISILTTLHALLKQTDRQLLESNQSIQQKFSTHLIDTLLVQYDQPNRKRDVKIIIYDIFDTVIHHNLVQLTTTQIKLLTEYIKQSANKSDEISLTHPALNLLSLILMHYNIDGMDELIQFVNTVLQTNNYVKIQLVCLQIIKQLTTADTQHTSINNNTVHQLYQSVYRLYQMNDIDNQIKNSVLYTISLLFTSYSNVLHSQFDPHVIQQYAARYNNDSTRVSCIQSITMLLRNNQLSQPCYVLYQCIEPNLLNQLTTKPSVDTYNDIYELYIALISNNTISQHINQQFVIQLLSKMIINLRQHANELPHSATILKLLDQLITQYHPHIDQRQIQQINDCLYHMISNTFIPDTILYGIIAIYNNILQHNYMTYNSLYQYFSHGLGVVSDGQHSKVIENYAKVYALCSSNVGTDQLDELIQHILTKLRNIDKLLCNVDISQTNFDLYILQYMKSTYQYNIHHSSIYDILYPLLNVEHIQLTVSHSMGAIATTDIQHYLLLILNQLNHVTQNEVNKYYLFISVKSFLQYYIPDSAAIQLYIQPVLHTIQPYHESNEEMIRNVIAENYAVLCQLNPYLLYPMILQLIQHNNHNIQIIGIHCIKCLMSYTLSTDEITSLSTQLIPSLIQLLHSTTDLDVKKQLLLCLTTVIHSYSTALQPHIATLLLYLYPLCIPDKSLIRTVDLGSFKHTIDDGLPVRKSVYGTLDIILLQLGQYIDRQQYCSNIMIGIADVNDIAILTYTMLSNAACRYPADIVPVVDQLPSHIMKAVKDQLKAAKIIDQPTSQSNNNSTTEQSNKLADNSAAVTAGERARDVLRGTVKCVVNINNIQSIDTVATWNEFYQRVLKTPQLAALINELQSSA